MSFRKGDRVEVMWRGADGIVSRCLGVVLYQRLRPPEYREPEAVSVRLDGRAYHSADAGSIFPAECVRALP